jgi:hypothetical protein
MSRGRVACFFVEHAVDDADGCEKWYSAETI